jgi:hypothetical protein
MPVSATGAILYVREGVGTDDASDLTASVFDWTSQKIPWKRSKLRFVISKLTHPHSKLKTLSAS